MTKTLNILDALARDRRVFTTAEFRERFGGSPSNAANALQRAIRDGLVERVAHGKYAIRELGRLATSSSTEDILVALSPLLRGLDHRIAYVTALEWHSLLLYPQPTIQVALASPTRTAQVSGRSLRQIIEISPFLSVGAKEAAHGCFVSDLPRTLLDAARRPDLIGGVDILVEALRLAGPVDVEMIVDHADRLHSAAALRRLGSVAGAADRADVVASIQSTTTIPVTPLPVDPSSTDHDVVWIDPVWNVAWDTMSTDLVGMPIRS